MHLTRLKKEVDTIEPENISLKVNKVDQFKSYMGKTLSTNFFIFSMIIILLAGLGFFISLNYFINPIQKATTISDYQPVTSKPVSLILNLSSPDDNLLVYDTNILVSGQTAPGILILININDNNQILNASKQGDFSQTLKLQPGVNQLIVSAFDNQGNFKTETRSIYYSEEKI